MYHGVNSGRYCTGVHSAGKVLNFHPHIHGVVRAGCFDREGTFHRIPFMPDEEQLEKVFMHKVLKMMMKKDKIHEDRGEKLTSWTNSGFAHLQKPTAENGRRVG